MSVISTQLTNVYQSGWCYLIPNNPPGKREEEDLMLVTQLSLDRVLLCCCFGDTVKI